MRIVDLALKRILFTAVLIEVLLAVPARASDTGHRTWQALQRSWLESVRETQKRVPHGCEMVTDLYYFSDRQWAEDTRGIPQRCLDWAYQR